MTHAHWTLDTKGYEHRLSQSLILVAFPLQHWLRERAHCHITRSLPILLRNTQNCTLPMPSGATYCIQTHRNQRCERHTVYSTALHNLAFEGLTRQRGTVSNSYNLLARFVKNRVGALFWVLQRSQNARSTAELNVILFPSKVQGFKFNVSSAVKFLCFPVCW